MINARSAKAIERLAGFFGDRARMADIKPLRIRHILVSDRSPREIWVYSYRLENPRGTDFFFCVESRSTIFWRFQDRGWIKVTLSEISRMLGAEPLRKTKLI